ncbi:TPA: ead/Ea22-like family protein, partial [Escherichia coli]|nr:ead/Ea22-like family protein [Escherichia coli]
AEKATKGSYIVGHTSVNQHGNLTGVFVCQKWKGEPGGVIAECHVNCLVETDAQAYANAEFIAAANPATVLALLDERERNQQYIKSRDQENEDIALTVGKLRVELEEVKQHAEELSETKAVRNQWRPDICPITGRAFFMWIEHPTLGNVPTYGGPLDSYTIPTKDGDGEFSCERYDHDFGGWVESECLGLYLIDDREQCRVYELEERVKELDAREISLPERSSMLHRTDYHDDYQTVMAYKVSEVIAAIRAAGIRIKGE